MKKAPLAVAVCAALFLAGCDGTSSPAGVGAGTGETKASAVSEGMAREKALEIARQQGTAQEVQLAGLIIEAVQELRPRLKGSFNPWMDSVVCGLGHEPERKQEVRAVLEEQGVIVIPGMELDIFITGEQADFNAACLAYIWADAVRPMVGWPRPNAQSFSQEANQELASWGAQQLALALATSQVLAPIANSLSKMPGATVEQLQERARDMVRQNANDLRQQVKETVQTVGSRWAEVTLNQTGQGPAPIHFTLADMDYQRGPAGALVSRHGTTVFGSGYLESVRYTVEAVTRSGQSMTRSSTTTATTDQTNTSTINAEARTQ